MTFLELGLEKNICDIMAKLNFLSPTEVQQKSIPPILFGKDVLVRSETGSGKTFAFVLPVLQKINNQKDDIQSLVVCPTRELAIQVADETKKIAEELNIRVCAVFGGSTIDRQIKSLKKKPQIVIGTTGRILDLLKRHALKLETVDYLVLDEADEMLDMGFKPDIEKILLHTKKDRQTLMFSATIPDGIKDLAKNYQNGSVLIEIGEANKAIKTIEQNYIYVQKKQKQNLLVELLYSEIYEKTIVFVNTKQYAEDLEHLLSKKKLNCRAIHGDMKQTERRRVLDAFRDGKIDVLLATDVAARGLDIKDVNYVVNFDLPHEIEFYVHRIGRTARAGKSGVVINLITSPEQMSYVRQIEKETGAKMNFTKQTMIIFCNIMLTQKNWQNKTIVFQKSQKKEKIASSVLESKAKMKKENLAMQFLAHLMKICLMTFMVALQQNMKSTQKMQNIQGSAFQTDQHQKAKQIEI